MGVIIALLVGVLACVLHNELRGLVRHAGRLLIRYAARRLEPDLGDRLFEEWTAHFNDQIGEFSQLGMAAGSLIASCRLSPPAIFRRTAKSFDNVAQRLGAIWVLAFLLPTFLLLMVIKSFGGGQVFTYERRTFHDGKQADVLVFACFESDPQSQEPWGRRPKTAFDDFMVKASFNELPVLLSIIRGHGRLPTLKTVLLALFTLREDRK